MLTDKEKTKLYVSMSVIAVVTFYDACVVRGCNPFKTMEQLKERFDKFEKDFGMTETPSPAMSEACGRLMGLFVEQLHDNLERSQ